MSPLKLNQLQGENLFKLKARQGSRKEFFQMSQQRHTVDQIIAKLSVKTLDVDLFP